MSQSTRRQLQATRKLAPMRDPTGMAGFISGVDVGADLAGHLQQNFGAKGLILRLSVTDYTNPAAPTTVDFTPELRLIHPGDGSEFTAWRAAAAVSANNGALDAYLIQAETIVQPSAITEHAEIPLPLGMWRIFLDVVGGDASNHADINLGWAYIL